MGRFDGKVVMITGGARGQGRNHALTFAREGADVIIYDAPPGRTPTVAYPPASVEELKHTEADVTALGRRCIAVEGDVRSLEDLSAAAERAIAELGHIDIALANAGVAGYSPVRDMSADSWREVVDINLTGVWNTIRSVIGHMADRKCGRIIATTSTMGRMGCRNGSNYAASKWGVIGLVKSAALEVAADGVTVNAVAPTAVNTMLIQNEHTYRLFRPDLENPTWDDCVDRFASLIPMGVPHIEVQDVTNAIMYLASEEARFVTGAVLDVSGGKAASWTA